MRMVSSVAAMRRLAMQWRRAGTRVGFVPTMGYLHAGHLSLIDSARKHAGPRGKVVVSIYVNPTQFGPNEDLNRYPRDLKRDLKLCRDKKVDVVFVPSDAEMYPGRASGVYSTYVVEEKLSRRMEGASRPGHFRGVVTVVAKLFNIVQPDIAVFGAKDWQQSAVVRQMTSNLNLPVRVVVAPTLREPDGLAMSSRNKYLEGDLRTQAAVLWRAIQKARVAVRKAARPIPSGTLKSELKRFIQREPAASVDYVEFFDPDTLDPVVRVARGTHMALAVFVGRTRLIDNSRL